MKALFIVTGRGLGGDAMVALNTMNALERKGVTCEIALDESAHGTLFEKNGYEWHRISVPHAGGHSATKLSAAKGAVQLFVATIKARSWSFGRGSYCGLTWWQICSQTNFFLNFNTS